MSYRGTDDWTFDPIAWLHNNVSPETAKLFREAWKEADEKQQQLAESVCRLSPFPYATHTTPAIERKLRQHTLTPTAQWAEGYRCGALDWGNPSKLEER